MSSNDLTESMRRTAEALTSKEWVLATFEARGLLTAGAARIETLGARVAELERFQTWVRDELRNTIDLPAEPRS